MRWLLLDPTVSPPLEIVSGVARASDGQLLAGSPRDPLIRDALSRGRATGRAKPTLVEIVDGDIRISTGLALRARLITLLGPRRAWRVAQVVATAQMPEVAATESRRGFAKRAAAVAAGVAGIVLLGPGPSTAHAQAGNVETTEVDAQGKKRPGKYSRREGIKRWTVKKQGSGYKVEFEHKDRKLSGEVRVSDGGGGETSSWSLQIKRDRWQLAQSQSQLAGTDDLGNAFTARWNRNRNQWETDRRSEETARRSRKELRIGIAIMLDLAPRRRSARGNAAASENAELSAQASCPQSCCHEHNLLEGSNDIWPLVGRAIACDQSTRKLEQECRDYSVTCTECCRILEGCDCLCEPWVGSDAYCWCSRYGVPYAPFCQS